MFDRFDIVEAWYTWLASHHCGIVSGKDHPDYWQSYNRLSTMESDLRFKPRYNLSEDTLSENSKEIYAALCQRCGFCDCVENN